MPACQELRQLWRPVQPHWARRQRRAAQTVLGCASVVESLEGPPPVPPQLRQSQVRMGSSPIAQAAGRSPDPLRLVRRPTAWLRLQCHPRRAAMMTLCRGGHPSLSQRSAACRLLQLSQRPSRTRSLRLLLQLFIGQMSLLLGRGPKECLNLSLHCQPGQTHRLPGLGLVGLRMAHPAIGRLARIAWVPGLGLDRLGTTHLAIHRQATG